MSLSFWKYKVHADILEGSWRGRQMKVGLSTTAIFGNLGGYFFENFRDNPAILYGDMLPLLGL